MTQGEAEFRPPASNFLHQTLCVFRLGWTRMKVLRFGTERRNGYPSPASPSGPCTSGAAILRTEQRQTCLKRVLLPDDHLPTLSRSHGITQREGATLCPGGVRMNGGCPGTKGRGTPWLTCALEALCPEELEAGSVHHQHVTPL